MVKFLLLIQSKSYPTDISFCYCHAPSALYYSLGWFIEIWEKPKSRKLWELVLLHVEYFMTKIKIVSMRTKFRWVCCRDLRPIFQRSEHFFLCSKWRHCYFIRIFLAVIDLFRKCSGATSVCWSNDDVINDRVERHLADYIFRKQALLRSRGRQYGINMESIINTESIFNE